MPKYVVDLNVWFDVDAATQDEAFGTAALLTARMFGDKLAELDGGWVVCACARKSLMLQIHTMGERKE